MGDRAYLYIRVSDQKQVDSGLSLEAQEQQVRDYYRDKLQPRGIEFGHLFREEAESATSKPLARRRQGQLLVAVVHPGDHIVIPKLDRAFRSLRDFCVQYEDWQKRGIILHVLNLGIDFSNPAGRAVAKLVVSILASFAEFESKMIGERTKAGMDVLRKQGKRIAGTRNLGYHIAKDGKLSPNEDDREIMREIARCIGEGHDFNWIAKRFNANCLRRPAHRKGGKVELMRWTASNVQRWHTAWLKIQKESNGGLS